MPDDDYPGNRLQMLTFTRLRRCIIFSLIEHQNISGVGCYPFSSDEAKKNVRENCEQS